MSNDMHLSTPARNWPKVLPPLFTLNFGDKQQQQQQQQQQEKQNKKRVAFLDQLTALNAQQLVKRRDLIPVMVVLIFIK